MTLCSRMVLDLKELSCSKISMLSNFFSEFLSLCSYNRRNLKLHTKRKYFIIITIVGNPFRKINIIKTIVCVTFFLLSKARIFSLPILMTLKYVLENPVI